MMIFIYLFIYLFICLFLLQCVKQEFNLFVSSKIQTACTFFLQTDYFRPTETAVDIALDVLENSNVNVCSEVFNKVVACQHEVWGDSIITSRPGEWWVYTFFVILRDGKLGGWVVLDQSPWCHGNKNFNEVFL